MIWRDFKIYIEMNLEETHYCIFVHPNMEDRKILKKFRRMTSHAIIPIHS